MGLNMDEHDEVVCYGCVGDIHLERIIKAEGSATKCPYCKKKRKAITVSRLADLVESVIREFLRPTNDYERGDGLDFYVADLLGCPDEDGDLVKAVCAELTNCSFAELKDGGESRFNDDDLFISRDRRPVQAERKWDEFRTGIMHKSRFFNQGGKDFLVWLFGNIDSFETYRRSDPLNHVVRILKADDDVKLFRARLCESPEVTLKIVMDPASQMAAPPREFAASGRMNPEGVPVFYGAFDRDTCVAELRPPVGGAVISGQFRLTQDVRVLDFKVLEKAYEPAYTSMFDPDYRLKQDRKKFLRTLHDKISSPVLPKQEREYLTTQVIAEYLSTQHTPAIDGVIFKSAQYEGGLNIVLFSHVVAVELPDEPLTPSSHLNVKKAGIEYVPGTLVEHKIGSVVFTPAYINEIKDGEPQSLVLESDDDDDWDW
jgi:hypothetical protein